MPEWLLVSASLIAFLALGVAFAAILRRASQVVAETRDDERFRRAVADLAARIDATLGRIVVQIDHVRRHLVPAEAVTDELTSASAAVAAYGAEAAALAGPAHVAEIRDNLVEELARAGRALEMVHHGCELLAAVRGGSRELEAQTAIKRGYLNVLHAREALVRHADDLAAGRSMEQRRWLSRRSPS
jgi:hypothetical protein